MRSVLDYGERIWEKSCKSCGGDLRYEADPEWRRFVCWQCGRPTPIRMLHYGGTPMAILKKVRRPRLHQ